MPIAAAPLRHHPGGEERDKGEVQIKDLIEGARLSAEIEDNVTWRESRPAQVTVQESDLVAEVQQILEAQAEERAVPSKAAFLRGNARRVIRTFDDSAST